MTEKADNTDQDVEAMMTACEGFNYVRFMMCSITGEPYLKAVPARHLKRFLKHGVQFWEGISILGAGCDVFKAIFDVAGTSNIPGKAMPGTVHALPWATDGKHKVGAVLTEPVYNNGEPVKAYPRYVARQQLERLAQRGLQLRSACEMEFMLLDGETKSKPVTSVAAYGTASGHAAQEEFMYDVDKQLYESGINLENIHEEYSPGQFEFVLTPSLGIDAADQVFKFKQAVREIALKNGMAATFMSMPFDGVGNGMHFNYSILDSSDNNMFFDATKPDNLSDFARNWIGGMMKHAKALTALSYSTVNCARRMGTSWSPSKVNWGLDDRNAYLRVKSQRAEYTHMENRLPGGGSNPYIVMAATIAAGLDGVENNIPCPPAVPMEAEDTLLPRSLSEALGYLTADKELCQALGDTFITWFLKEKEGSQLTLFPNWEANEQSLAKEKDRFLLVI